MANILDIFNQDAYSLINLVRGIEKLPYKPGRLGAAGIFDVQGVDTWTISLEFRSGKIYLIPSTQRGSGKTNFQGSVKGKEYAFNVQHLRLDDEVSAAECGRRQFGSTDVIENINSVIQRKGLGLRNSHEATAEYHRIGAIQGKVLDADGTSTLVNLFTTFGIGEETVDFALNDQATEVKLKCQTVRRIIEDRLGAQPFTGIVAQCSRTYWDDLIVHASVKKAYERWNDGQFGRELQVANANGEDIQQFEFAGILFQLYRGKIGTIDFIPTGTARFYPTGVQGLFIESYGPANFIETIGTVGIPFYMKQERQKFDMGVDLHSQSNPCVICTDPGVLVKGTKSAS